MEILHFKLMVIASSSAQFFWKYMRSNTNKIAILLVGLKKLYVNACIIQVEYIADIAIYSLI